MNNSNFGNSLEKNVFEEQISFSAFEEILEELDHITPVKISREQFNSLNEDFLAETGEDENGKFYELYLPDDLQKGELLYFVDFLTTKFDIQDYTPINKILTQTKIGVLIALRNIPETEKDKYINDLAEKYNISDELIQKIKSHKITRNFSASRDFIKSIKENRENEKISEKLGSEDISNIQEELARLFGEEFELTFFRKGIDTLRAGMMTITQAEQQEIKNKKVKKGEEIKVKIDEEHLDEQERLLREKIEIDKLKDRLEKARNSGDDQQIVETEKEAANIITTALYEYPFQFTSEDNGYKPSGIKNKELYCVGYSLLGHAFLNELGIEHYGLDIPGHSALEVVIRGERFYFDATGFDKIKAFNYGEQRGIYRKILLKYGNLKKNLGFSGNPEKILFSGIYKNKGISLDNLGKYKEAIEMYNRALELNPYDPIALYNDKGVSLDNLGKYKEAIEMYNEALKLNPYNTNLYNNKGVSLFKRQKMKLTILYKFVSNLMMEKNMKPDILFRKEKREIKKFIQNKDYEGLKDYLFSLED